ncbi:hypothetical protein [Sphingomonas paucimobilis]|uniref:hypothetical protein n=1 Tax=Sphingomonas paucimobilis TaxID=13689 RepID=UPI0030FBCFCC
MALDLTELKRVADAGLPLDNVPVSRRWLARVWTELHAARSQTVQLDHDPYLRPVNSYTPPLSATA